MNLSDDDHAALKQAVDQMAIQQVLGTYCRAIDRLDVALLRSVYHDDAVDDHGVVCMNAHEFASYIVAELPKLCAYSMHTVTHAVIEVNGDFASSEAYYLAFHRVEGGEASLGAFFGPRYFAAQQAAGCVAGLHAYDCGGRYLDVFERRQGVWRILRREITNEFAVCRAAGVPQEGLPAAFHKPGRRDAEDPSYQTLRYLRELAAGDRSSLRLR